MIAGHDRRADSPHPPRRHGRVLRVRRAARRPVAARPAGRRRRRSGRRAASSARRATRRARSACARRCRWRSAVRLCPELVDRAARLRELRARSRDQVFAIFRERHAAGRAALARRGLPRRHRERLGHAARRDVARRLKERIREETAAHRLGRRRAEQVPREDRLGLEEARRPDRDRPRARRGLPRRSFPSTRCGASGP